MLGLNSWLPWALNDREVVIKLASPIYPSVLLCAVCNIAPGPVETNILVKLAILSSFCCAVIEACKASGNDIHQIMSQLLGQSGSNPTAAANNNASTSISMPNNGEPSSSINNENVEGDPDSNDEGTSAPGDVNERDVEMEDELANDLTGDVFADYDIEVTKEGEAICEYLSLLDSVAGIANEKTRNGK